MGDSLRTTLTLLTATLCALTACPEPEPEPATAPTQVFFQAHRGGMDEVPENTLAAFQHAWRIPGAVPEVDIRTTSDGALVCIHDETPRRTTNAPPPWDKTPINQIPLETLRTWDAGAHFNPQYTGEKIPLLEELFQMMQDHPQRELYLDLKDVELAALLKKIRAYKLEKQVIFVHGNPETCKTLHALYPGARTMTWLSGLPQQQKEKFEALAADNFNGISQLQFHLRHTATEPQITYTHDNAYLREAARRTQAAGTELQLRPFAFTPESLRQLTDLGIRWFVADAPRAFHNALNQAASGGQPAPGPGQGTSPG